MSQPPGQYGGQYGQPGPYGQPGQPGQYGPPSQPGQYGQPNQGGQYGQPSQPGQYGQPNQGGQYGQPGQYGAPGQPGQYGQPGPYGPGGPGGYGPGGGPGGYGQPPKKNALPWIITAVVVVLVGAGVLTFFLVRGNGNGTTPVASSTAASSTTSSSAASSTASSSTASSRSMPSMGGDDTGSIPGGATSGTMNGGSGEGSGQYPGSDQVALAWMKAMAQQDFDTAFSLTCSDLQTAAQQAASQSGGASASEILGAFFYKTALNGQGIANGSEDSVQYDPSEDVDDVAFTLQLEDNSTASVTLSVGSDLTVCNWTTS